jgi:hypothetical protein
VGEVVLFGFCRSTVDKSILYRLSTTLI